MSSRILRALLLPGLPMALSLCLTAPAQTQTVGELPTAVQLNSGGAPNLPAISLRMALGDLNNDGDADVVFSNELAYLQVYFMRANSTRTSVSVIGHDTVQAIDTNKVYFGWGTTHPLIYDLDLDGTNELIYIEESSAQNVSLVRYEYNPTTKKMVRQTWANGSNASLSGLYQWSRYGQNQSGYAFQLAIANVRGRAYPQDIVVWNTQRNDVAVFGFDQGKITRLFLHRTHDSTSGNKTPGMIHAYASHAGHTWKAIDLDYDGTDEIVGTHVLKWSPATSSVRVQWGMVVKPNEGSSNAPNNTHIDHIEAADFARAFLNEKNVLVPSPGLEVLAAAQLGASGLEPSGLWIYRAPDGHSLTTKPTSISGTNRKCPPPASSVELPRTWPRKVVGFDLDYEFGDCALNVTRPPWRVEPNDARMPRHTAFPYSSNWKEYKNFMRNNSWSNPVKPSTNSQAVALGHFLSDRERPVALVLTKAIISGMHCRFHHSYTVDNDPLSRILDWDYARFDSSVSHDHVSIRGSKLIDNQPSRAAVNLYSFLYGDCPSNPGQPFINTFFRLGAASNPNNRGSVQTTQTHQWYPLTMSNMQPYRRSQGANERLGGTEGSAPWDIFKDTREELVMFRTTGSGAGLNSWLMFVEALGNPDASRNTQPAPSKFLSYRVRTVRDVGAPMYQDYRKISGLRFLTESLAIGDLNQAYGITQDPNLFSPASARTGCAIVAEGGVPPYSMSISLGALHDGLTATLRTTATSTGNSTGAVLMIEGTPRERGTKRFRVTVTDSQSKSRTQDFWLNVRPGVAGGPNHTPRIREFGFFDTYLSQNAPSTVTILAKIDDTKPGGGSDLNGVFAFFNGALLPQQLVDDGLNNDGAANDGLYGLKIPQVALPAGDHAVLVIATDAAGNFSTIAPFLTVPGGLDHTPDQFQTLPVNRVGQTSANTPRIERVALNQEMEPAQRPQPPYSSGLPYPFPNPATDQIVSVRTSPLPAGQGVVRVEARLYHADARRFYQHDATSLVKNGNVYTFDWGLPRGNFGWGEYTVQLKVVTSDGTREFESDWWPRLSVR